MRDEDIRGVIWENGFQQSTVAHLCGTTDATFSRFVRGLTDVDSTLKDRIKLTLTAMVQLKSESPFPISWTQPELLRPAIEARVVALRRARSQELAHKFKAECDGMQCQRAS